MPTRFKYTAVPSKSFGLTPAEILMATDAELNQYVSVKKYAPYKKEKQWDQTRGDRLRDLKQKLKERGADQDDLGGQGIERPVKKRKGKKERMKAKTERSRVDVELGNDRGESTGSHEDRNKVADKRKSKRRKKNASAGDGTRD